MQRFIGGLALLVVAAICMLIARDEHPVAAQNSTTGMVGPQLMGTGSPVSNSSIPCTATNLAAHVYIDTQTTPNGSRLWTCDNSPGTWGWHQLQFPISGSTASFGGSVILLGGSITSTASVPGALVGSNCMATRTDGTFLGVGLVIDCAVLTSGTATIRISALIGGTPPAGTYSVRVIS